MFFLNLSRMKFKYLILLLVISGLAGNQSKAQVTADFSVNKSSGCSPLTVNFTANCSPSDNVTYSWDLGNGNTSDLQNPSATYNDPGNYTVKLTATRNGLSSSKSRTIKVFKNPVANFSTVDGMTKACIPLTVRFSDLSTAGDTTLRSWQWEYGTGDFDTLRQRDYTYTSVGNRNGFYNVTLKVTDDHGCFNTKTINDFVDVANPPQVSFYANPTFACSVPADIKFVDNSSVKGTPSYQWIMGSSASILSTATFRLNKYDTTYTVKLSVTDVTYNTNNNCTSQGQLDYSIKHVKAIGTVKQGPHTINYTNDIVCAGTVNLESHSLPKENNSGCADHRMSSALRADTLQAPPERSAWGSRPPTRRGLPRGSATRRRRKAAAVGTGRSRASIPPATAAAPSPGRRTLYKLAPGTKAPRPDSPARAGSCSATPMAARFHTRWKRSSPRSRATSRASSLASTATTTPRTGWPTRSPRCARAHGRCRARSTASASAAAMPTSSQSSPIWQSRRPATRSSSRTAFSI